MNKTSFSEAARIASIHPNTIRNWRKAGKLKTAEKVFENGVEVWIVDAEEVLQILTQSRSTSNINNINTVSAPNIEADQPTNFERVGFEQSLVFMRESVVKPLTDLLERQSDQIKQMSEELGILKERIKNLELEKTIQVSPNQTSEPQNKLDVLNSVENPKKRRWWQFK